MLNALRSHLVISTILLGLAGLSSWLVIHTSSLPHTDQITSTAKMEDGHAHHIMLWQFNEQGQLHYQLKANNMTHYSNDTSLFEQPFLILYGTQTQTPPWKIRAERANVNQQRHVKLSHHVTIWRAASSQTRATQVLTSLLWVFPEKNYASTTKFVTIKEPNTINITTGVGMKATLNPSRLQLLKDVKTQYATR